MKTYLVTYGITEPIEGRWFISKHVIIHANSESDAVDRFHQIKEIVESSDYWEIAEVTAEEIKIY